MEKKKEMDTQPMEVDTKENSITYLSIDIGIRNFAYCLVSMPETRILQWENIDLLIENGVTKNAKQVSMAQIRPLLIQSLEKRFEAFSVADHILMEQQIGHSRNAKLEGMVSMWLHLRLQKPIHNVSPRLKLGVNYGNNAFTYSAGVDAQKYELRKLHTVNLINHWIPTQPANLQSIFWTAAKQDDLADVLVQAIAVHIKGGKTSKPKKKRKEKKQ